jgi:hypothetical protein
MAELGTRRRSIRMIRAAVILTPRHDQKLLTIDRISVPSTLISQLNSDLCSQRQNIMTDHIKTGVSSGMKGFIAVSESSL